MAGTYGAALLDRALPVITRANPALLASGTWHLAVSEPGMVIGCGGWTAARPDTVETRPAVGHVRHFATHPDWIGRGVGRALYLHAERQALEAGIRRFICYASLNAVPFYGALGFRSLRRIEVPLPGGVPFPAMLMEHELERS